MQFCVYERNFQPGLLLTLWKPCTFCIDSTAKQASRLVNEPKVRLRKQLYLVNTYSTYRKTFLKKIGCWTRIGLFQFLTMQVGESLKITFQKANSFILPMVKLSLKHQDETRSCFWISLGQEKVDSKKNFFDYCQRFKDVESRVT